MLGIEYVVREGKKVDIVLERRNVKKIKFKKEKKNTRALRS